MTAVSRPPVFLLPGTDPAWAGLTPDEAFLRRQINGGRPAWILQTWARLRQAGLPAVLSRELPRAGLVVLHADDYAQLDRRLLSPRLWTVVCRADRIPHWRADFEIVQNPLQADGRRAFYVNHWTQPGLLPREPGRGTTVRRVGYFGMFKHLPPAIRSPEWPGRLAALGLEWVTPGNASVEAGIDFSQLHDYSGIDVVIALRDPAHQGADHKPPTKLLNAWLAGVPAIVGPESAYRALHRDALDYLEADDADTALAALQRLRDDPKLYSAMCRRARERAAEIAPAATARVWHELLTVRLPSRQRAAAPRLLHLLRAGARSGQRLYARVNRRHFRHYDSA
ncbi:MAG TPA: glycosyltransferase [Opitutaceae bacterium]|nr:glycosyltransferase [Opitutaceae bacterium]